MPLPLDELHVWRVDVTSEALNYAFYADQLEPLELGCARRFRFDTDRLRYVISRGTLRCLLGRYLHTDPAALQIGSSLNGKPFLASPTSDLSFNSSHSDGAALHAFCRAARIGVDIEAVKHSHQLDYAHLGVLAPEELESLQSHAGPELPAVFAQVWTRKEAYVKAVGTGLGHPLDWFCIGPSPDNRLTVIYDRQARADSTQWHLVDLDVGQSYAACVAFCGRRRALRMIDYKLETIESM
jgi:4'-phosphopantetheinyl transferase